MLRFNRPAIEEKIARAAAYLGIPGGFDGFHDFVREINAALGIPATLTELGVKNPPLDAMVESALRDPSAGGNPVPLTAENVRALYEAGL